MGNGTSKNIYPSGLDNGSTDQLQTVSLYQPSRDYAQNPSKMVPHTKQSSAYETRFCWRQCGGLGTQMHMWWGCPITTLFWRQAGKLLTEVLNYKIVLSPELAILDTHLAKFPKPLRTVLQHILISARFVIAQEWNSPNSLPLSEVICRTNCHCHCETKLISSPQRCQLLCSLWEPWIGSRYYS